MHLRDFSVEVQHWHMGRGGVCPVTCGWEVLQAAAAKERQSQNASVLTACKGQEEWEGEMQSWDETLSLSTEKASNKYVISREQLAFLFLPNYCISGLFLRKKDVIPPPSFPLPVLNTSRAFAYITPSCNIAVSLHAWVNPGVPGFIFFP